MTETLPREWGFAYKVEPAAQVFPLHKSLEGRLASITDVYAGTAVEHRNNIHIFTGKRLSESEYTLTDLELCLSSDLVGQFTWLEIRGLDTK